MWLMPPLSTAAIRFWTGASNVMRKLSCNRIIPPLLLDLFRCEDNDFSVNLTQLEDKVTLSSILHS